MIEMKRFDNLINGLAEGIGIYLALYFMSLLIGFPLVIKFG